jgi:hypothetical protein
MHRHAVTAVNMNIVQAHSYSCAHEHCTGTQLQLCTRTLYRHTVTAVHMNIVQAHSYSCAHEHCTGAQLQLCTLTYVQAHRYSCAHEHMHRHAYSLFTLCPIPCHPHAHQILPLLPAPHTRKVERARYILCNFKYPATRFGNKC